MYSLLNLLLSSTESSSTNVFSGLMAVSKEIDIKAKLQTLYLTVRLYSSFRHQREL